MGLDAHRDAFHSTGLLAGKQQATWAAAATKQQGAQAQQQQPQLEAQRRKAAAQQQPPGPRNAVRPWTALVVKCSPACKSCLIVCPVWGPWGIAASRGKTSAASVAGLAAEGKGCRASSQRVDVIFLS